jgi:hypothetical protein
MSLHTELQALADTLAPADAASKDLAHANGEVTAITDGVLTVTVRGDEVQAGYYGETPAVGDTVGVLFIAGSPIILGVPRGVPPTTPSP